MRSFLPYNAEKMYDRIGMLGSLVIFFVAESGFPLFPLVLSNSIWLLLVFNRVAGKRRPDRFVKCDLRTSDTERMSDLKLKTAGGGGC